VYCCIEFVCKTSVEDGVVWVVEVYHVKGDILYSCILLVSK
jgi:hypothetical protein